MPVFSVNGAANLACTYDGTVLALEVPREPIRRAMIQRFWVPLSLQAVSVQCDWRKQTEGLPHRCLA
jgi:hypothetical protein